jgi:Aspartyl protease/PDZ domain
VYRAFLAPLLLITLAARPAPTEPVPPSFALAPDAETRWIPFTLTPGNQIRFTMALDSRPVTAVLDTGVSYSVLSRRYAEMARIKVAPAGVASAIGGTVPIGSVATASLSIGALARRGGKISVAELPALATGSATAIDLLVGRDLLARYALDIDYAGKRFRVLPSGRLPFTGQSAPLWIARDKLVYATEMTLGRQRLRPVVVDTGDGSAVTVTASGWAAAAVPGVRTTTAISYGLAGPTVSTLGIVPTLTLGQLTARRVEVRVEPRGDFSDTIGVAGRIGSGFLQRYRVLLDPSAGRIVLQPGPEADTQPLRSTSGLLTGLARDRLRVIHVMKGGPAAATGWKNGDEICAVDGQPITATFATTPLARWSAGEPGRVVTLGLCDGTTRTLTLKSFY